mgnify:CR=1 FL=1
MSKARAKGTVGENFFLETLRRVFGSDVERAPLKGVLDHGDYVNVPWLHEAKNTAKPLFLKWARQATEKAARSTGHWVVMWKGDLRKNEGPYVLMPLYTYELLARIADDAWNYGVTDEVVTHRLYQGDPF